MADPSRSWTRAAALAAICLLAPAGCEGELLDEQPLDDTQMDDAATDEDEGPTLGSLRWRLTWADSEEGGPWHTTNDLGYEVHVEAAWLGAWGASLIECEEQAASAMGAAAREQAPAPGLASPWLVAEGHPGEADPSGVLFDRAERFAAVDAGEVTSIVVEPTAYCEAHFVFAGMSEASGGFAEAEAELAVLAPEDELEGASLIIVGSWMAPEGGEATPFVLRSDDAYGLIVPLEVEALTGGEVHEDVEIALERRLAGLFDGVEFVAPTGDPAWTVLGNLACGSRIVAR